MTSRRSLLRSSGKKVGGEVGGACIKSMLLTLLGLVLRPQVACFKVSNLHAIPGLAFRLHAQAASWRSLFCTMCLVLYYVAC